MPLHGVSDPRDTEVAVAMDRDLQADLIRLEALVDSGDIVHARHSYEVVGVSSESHVCVDHRFHLQLISAKIAAVEGEFRKALAIGESLLQTCRASDSRRWIGKSHVLLSWFLLRLGDYLEAQKHGEAAVHYCRWEIDDKRIEGDAWNNLGLINKNLGLWEDAERDLRRALEAYAHLGDLGLNLRVSLNLAVLLRKIGKLDEASSICQEALHLASELGDPARVCRLALESANIAVIRREAAEAAEHVETARATAKEMGYRRELVLAREVAGDVAGIRGDYEEALALYGQGLELACGFAKGCDLECEILRREGAALLSMGNLGEAKASIEEALKLAEALKDKYEHAVCLRVLGQIEIGEGLMAKGIDRLAESVERLCRLSAWCHEVAVSEIALGDAYLSLDGEADGTAGLEHMLIARRVYSNLGMGVAVREIDGRISSMIDGSRKRPASGVVRKHGDDSRPSHGIDLEQYGIVTADERIVGDLARWGASDVRVLIEGETGVGKELVARALHAMSRRREETFAVVDCGGLSETLAESELFGHVKGAFTGAFRDRKGLIETGDGGTLFLDEVGELSEALQVKLLRVLEERVVRPVGETRSRSVDVRLVSATTKDLWGEVEAGRFRRDLYYRLRGVVLRIPSLRERRGDIDLLLDHFLESHCESYGKVVRLSGDARRMLLDYEWPGNVRELKSVVEALVVSSEDGVVIRTVTVERFLVSSGSKSGLSGRLKEVERVEIERALSACGGNKSKAAKMLGINRKTLRRKIRLLSGYSG